MADVQGFGEQVSAEAQHRLWWTMDASELRLSVVAMSAVRVVYKIPAEGHQETAGLSTSCLMEVSKLRG